MHPTKIIVVGQTPPPVCGQSLAIQRMLEGDYGAIELHHVRMGFSRGVDEMGRFRAGKLVELLRVIARIVYLRFREGADVLWYPPAGDRLTPVLRDMAILLTTRRLFRKTIFCFHASGVADAHDRLPAPLRPLFRAAYFEPDAAIHVSESAPDDGRRLQALRCFVVPNGVPDEAAKYAGAARVEGDVPVILYVGTLAPEKGVRTLLEAARRLAAEGRSFRLRLMGRFVSPAFRQEVTRFVAGYALEGHVEFLGERTGEEKHRAFAGADVYCHPSTFETCGLSVVEALSFGLPVVATRTGGLPSVVGDGRCGWLVEVGDAGALAGRLAALLSDPALRRRLGHAARRRYLDLFTVDRYHERLRDVFTAVLSSPNPTRKPNPTKRQSDAKRRNENRDTSHPLRRRLRPGAVRRRL